MTHTPHTTPYPAYKDSGVEWIGEIPEGWAVKKLKYVFENLNHMRVPLSAEIRAEMAKKDYDYYGASGIIDKVENYIFDETLVLIGEDGANLLSRSSRLAFLASGKYWVNNHAHILKPKSGDIKYFVDLLETIDYTTLITGSAQPKLTQENLINIAICVPPVEEQNAIARYLDEKTAQVDQLIQQSEKIIALLREQRSAVINHAVTKGLTHLPPEQDGTLGVPLYDSGVEWIGEVPEGWAVKKLKYVIKSTLSGGTPSTENDLYWEGDIPWVSAKDMKFDEINSSQDYITELAIKESSTTLVPVNSVLMVVRSGILKHTLPTAINSVEVAINQDLKAFTPIDALTAKYLWYIFKGLSNEILTSCSKLSATVDSIEMGFLENFAVSLPPLSQQIAIARYLDEKTAEIDALAEREERRIELLREYRSALISEVVTGKVRVGF